MKVEVAYATPEQQIVVEIELPPGSTLEQAIVASGLLKRFPAIDLLRDGVGIFGARRALTDTLREGDRVEIYRPLKADPRDQRRRRTNARCKVRESANPRRDRRGT